MRKLEENDPANFEEGFNVWLSDEPLTNDEIYQLMRTVERERKLEWKPNFQQLLEKNGGDDETRTRDLCRDRAAF